MTPLLAALGIVFVAELGDKTQLVAMGLGARHRLGPVLLGVVLAYAVTMLVAVAVGGVAGSALPGRALGIGGGLVFLGFALWTARDHRPADDGDGVGPLPASAPRVVATVAGAMILAEMGDKTMLATATLAARGDPVMVWIGATIGITLSGAVGVLLGRTLGVHLPERTVRLGSAALFAVFGVALLVTSL